jgi:hypothetical protein
MAKGIETMVKINRRSSVLLVSAVVSAMAMALGTTMLMPAVATAPMPPQLVRAKLNGQPVNVLYVTRSNDRVIVRCYPGLQPAVAVRDRGDGTKEGDLTCAN